MTTPAPSVMDENAPQGQESQTVEIPLSAAPMAKEGAMLSLKVISVDSQSGVINAVIAPMDEEMGSATDKMASEIEQPENQG